ncbi:cytochrome o ubiquinol oxidase subunit III [Candidatus Saccharibacteria bacterium 49-20]|nr:MAG: cytochrome o ubiquinol oxidase subunit III [Candidatus Saccharibacteria bacterium 49-20]
MNREKEELAVFSRKTLGFWVYLMTDCVLFATLFATFAVLRTATAGGPAGSDIFDLNFVLIETMILLTSSFTVGLALLAAERGLRYQSLTWLVITFALGATFLGMELWEFNHLIGEGHGWQQSAFLSSYFVLVGTHGLHIAVGLIWMAVVIFRLIQRNFKETDVRRLSLLSLFWHFLDIIWIFIFSFVYLIGGMA